MINRKFMAIALPLVTFATLVGSGFSAWFFGSATVNPSGVSANVEVTTEVSAVGQLQTTVYYGSTSKAISGNTSNNLKMILDQGGNSNASDDTKGIYFVYADTSADWTSDKASKLVVNYNITEQQVLDLAKAGLKPVLTTTITINGYDPHYSTWLADPDAGAVTTDNDTTASTFSSTFSSATGVLTATQDIDGVTNITIDLSTTAEYVNSLVQYKQKPSDGTELGNMSTAMGSVSFSINTAVTFPTITVANK